MSKHTPTPWKWEASNDRCKVLVGEIKSGDLCICAFFDADKEPETFATGAFIVHACNIYDELVATLKHARMHAALIRLASERRSVIASIDAALAKAGAA